MGYRILVVDDEAYIVQVLSIKLRNAGHEVLTAADGEEALEIAQREHPDLVITDFQMPYMTGLELVRGLAEQAQTRAIPVIMLTARGYALSPEDLAAGSIRAVLGKPFGPRDVLRLVETTLGGEAAEADAA